MAVADEQAALAAAEAEVSNGFGQWFGCGWDNGRYRHSLPTFPAKSSRREPTANRTTIATFTAFCTIPLLTPFTRSHPATEGPFPLEATAHSGCPAHPPSSGG